MKSTSVYFDKNLRCRVKPTGFGNQARLTIQKRFLFFWLDTDFWKEVKEGYWGEDINRPGFGSPLVVAYESGHTSEAYKTGTLDLAFVIRDFIEQYQEVRAKKIKVQQELASLGQRVAIIEGKIRDSKQQPAPPNHVEIQAPDNPGYTERLRDVDRHYDLAPPNRLDSTLAAAVVPPWVLKRAKAVEETIRQDVQGEITAKIDKMMKERGQVMLSGKEVADRLDKATRPKVNKKTKSK